MVFSRRSIASSIAVAGLLLSARNHAQTERAPAVQNSAITLEGHVVADDTGLPIPNARVSTTSGINGSMPIVPTDGEGRFVFSFPPGTYNVSAVKTGYARREVPPPQAGQPIEIRLRPGAAISGRVIDEFGDPVAGVRVALETPPNGSRDSSQVTATTSNDLGEYRFGGLQDGVFLPLVVTTGPPQQVRVNDNVFVTNLPLRTYFPGVTSAADAQRIELHAGETRDGIDFLLTARQAIEQPFAVDRFLLMPPPNVGPAPRGDGLIRGQITGTDGRGVPRASIVLMPLTNPTNRPALPHVTRSGSDGRFEFGELAPGRFRVLVSKGGYLSITGDGPTIDLSAAETRDRVQISLTRFGTINGRVLDEYGFPVMRARVQALHIRYEGGRRKLVAASTPDALADDRGMFRLYFLEPGQYIVSAFIGDVSSEDVPGYARTYFPGAATAGEGQFVSIGPGQDLTGLDIPLARTQTARISGRWVDSHGKPGGGSLTLTPTWRAGAAPAEATGAHINPADGRFEFRNVPPGEYVIQASRGRTNAWTEGEFGALPVTVNGADVNDVVLQTSAGSSVSGLISFDTIDRTKLPSRSAIEITALPFDPDQSPPGAWANARIQSDWQFQMFGLTGPRRLIATKVPEGWTVSEIRVGGTDATDRPLPFGSADQSLAGVEIILSDRVSQLNGSVNDDTNRPVRGAHVIAFSADRDRWYFGSRFLRETITDDQGIYRISGLPFGTYYVTTLTQVSPEGPEAWQDSAFLTSQMSRSSMLTISEGQKVTRALRVSSK